MTKLTILAAICILATATTSMADEPPYGGIKLLEGYRYKRDSTTDTINGFIYKSGGLSIEFESGISEGYAVNPKKKGKYSWYREQVVNGRKVYVALGESGVVTRWKPVKPRGSKPVRVLMVTFPGDFGPTDAANFYAEVLDEREVADTLLMVLTFDPTK